MASFPPQGSGGGGGSGLSGLGSTDNAIVRTDGTDGDTAQGSGLLINDSDLLQLGGTSSSFPAIKRNGAVVEARLADDSDYANVEAEAFVPNAANPTVAYQFNSNTGLKNWNGASFSVDANGAVVLYVSQNVLRLASGVALEWNDDTTPQNGTADIFVARKGAANLRIGGADAASPTAYTVQVGTSSRGSTDTNVAGANGTINSGVGTGNATGSKLVLQTPTAGASGTTAQTLATRLELQEGTSTLTGTLVRDDTYAHIYVKDGSTTQTSIGTTAAKVTGFATNGESNDCTADASNDKITITRAGKYLVTFSCSFVGSSDAFYTAFLRAGGTETLLGCSTETDSTIVRKTMSCSGVLDLSAQDLEVYIESDDGGGSDGFQPNQMHLTVHRLGA